MSIDSQKLAKTSQSQTFPNSKDVSTCSKYSIDKNKGKGWDKILGIDFGSSKVGLAMADLETKIAFAYTTLKNDKNFLANLLEIMEKENIKSVVIGVPKFSNLKSKSNLEKRKEYQKLGSLIEKNRPKIKVFFVNEMFSTKMAENNLKEKGTKNIKRFDDQEAARVILQSWLDKMI